MKLVLDSPETVTLDEVRIASFTVGNLEGALSISVTYQLGRDDGAGWEPTETFTGTIKAVDMGPKLAPGTLNDIKQALLQCLQADGAIAAGTIA